MVDVLHRYREQFDLGLPFVLFRKPDSKRIVGLMQSESTLYNLENGQEKGFVFAPFDGAKPVLLPSQKCQVELIDFVEEQEPKNFNAIAISGVDASKRRHIDLVREATGEIRKGEIKKIVISRKETVSLVDFDFLNAFTGLAKAYKSAMAYCFFHPRVGLWMGAFSEQLLLLRGNEFRTMSVAGTQLYTGNQDVVWGSKEKQEQQWVTDFIVSHLKPFAMDLQVSKPYNLRAGHLMHIKTDVFGILKDRVTAMELLQVLHPTPAVCGFPKEPARDFLLKNEGYDRAYYSGFLGTFNFNPENGDDETNLYVNLRCVAIDFNEERGETLAHIYVGGGITSDSDPEKEWEETVNKADTIKSVLFNQ